MAGTCSGFFAQAQLALQKTDKCHLKLNTKVKKVKDVSHQKLNHNWEIHTADRVYKVKYLVNSCGYKTGQFDESLHLAVDRLIEFKAAYVSKWQPIEGPIPELIFHGKRGTPHGMAQLTPYCDDYYQIHGMTRDITLFQNGLMKSDDDTSQPEFNAAITQKLRLGWQQEEVKTRTENAIRFVAKFVPSFESAMVGGPPLFGQQIPGDDPDLRVGEVSFPCRFYARSEIIKASSALFVANQIIAQMQEEGIVSSTCQTMPAGHNQLLDNVSKADIDQLASHLAASRGYPASLSRLVVEKAEKAGRQVVIEQKISRP